MGSTLSLIHLPAQSGKTRKMTDLINKWKGIIQTEKLENNLNIIFTSNTKLLAKQTKKRVIEHVDNNDKSTLLDDADEYLDDISEITDDTSSISTLGCDENNEYDEKQSRTFAWVHEPNKRVNGKKQKTKDVDSLCTDILAEDLYDNIICCTNATRIKHVFALLNKLNTANLKNRFQKKVSIWIDEADACMNIWKKYISAYAELGDFIASGVMITATMMPVYKYLSSKNIVCNLRVYENTHTPTYHKYKDSIINHTDEDNADNVIVYINKIIEETAYIPENSKWFCPGNKQKSSHEQVCAALLQKGFNVLILNGDKKEIRYTDGRLPTPIMERLEDDLEIAKTLNYIYYSNQLFNQPFAVTGHLCIGRGITFASQESLGEFMFTHGIIPDIANGEEAYQIVSRCLGNIKGFVTYTPPHIFISKKLHSKILEQETFAIEFASKFYDKNVETVVVTPNIINAIVGRNIINEDDNGEDERQPRRRRENKLEGAVPVKLIMQNELTFEILIQKRNEKNYREKMDLFIKECIANGNMLIVDNNAEPNRFVDSNRTLNTIRMYKLGQDTKNRRFKNFSEALETRKEISQTCEKGQYTLDFAKDDYINVQNKFENSHLIAWITYTKNPIVNDNNNDDDTLLQV